MGGLVCTEANQNEDCRLHAEAGIGEYEFALPNQLEDGEQIDYINRNWIIKSEWEGLYNYD